MRRLALFVCIAAALACAWGCAGRPPVKEGTPVIHLADMQEDDYQGLETRLKSGTPVIVEVPAGTRLPVAVNVDTPMGAIEQQELQLAIKTDMFILIGGKGFWLSRDKKTWCAAGDVKGMREMFGYSAGTFSVGLSATKEAGPEVKLDIMAK